MEKNKDFWLVIGAVIVAVLAAGVFWLFGDNNVENGQNGNGDNISNFEECVEQGNTVLETFPRVCRLADGTIFIEDIGNDAEKRNVIIVNNPQPGEDISSPVTVRGEARGTWYFEADFPVTLYDGNRRILAQGAAQAQGDWMTENFVPFSVTLTFPNPETQAGHLVLSKANPSGLPENADELIVPVLFAQTAQGTTNVQVHFISDEQGVQTDCSQTTAVTRSISSTPAIARAALEELLEGPTTSERNRGLSTAINEGVEIQQLTISGGTARVDFSQELEAQVGGSCRVAAIVAQITNTLEQFSTVDNVVISINGRTEDILQP